MQRNPATRGAGSVILAAFSTEGLYALEVSRGHEVAASGAKVGDRPKPGTPQPQKPARQNQE
jgi:hypothetical protein